MVPSRDPEVLALTSQIRALTSQARRLSRDIDSTVEELAEFSAEIQTHRAQERRRAQVPYRGEDRRRD